MKKILICDDEMIIREFLAELIEDEIDLEMEVTFAGDGSEGIETLKRGDKFDLIICDMNMKEINGDKVYEVNKEVSKVPFIMLSGHELEYFNDLEGFNEENNCKVLQKPWDEELLIKTVKDYLTI